MEKIVVLNLPNISGIDKLPIDLVKRDAFIHQIAKILEQNDLVFLQGDEGVGKTTLLLDFAYQNSSNTISHFIIKNYNYSSSFDCILENLFRQIHFYCWGEELSEEFNIDLSTLSSIQSKFYKVIKNRAFKKEELYFIFDGFETLTSSQLESLFPLFDILPFSKAKFIFTGDSQLLEKLLKSKKISTKEFQAINFSINETKEYFKDLTFTDIQISEIHKLADKGIPAKLKEIKLLCIDNNGIDNSGVNNFFKYSENGIGDFNYYDKLWDKVNHNDELQLKILSVIAFNDIQLTISSICEILKIDILNFNDLILKLPFIEIVENNIKYQTESLRFFARKKLIHQEDDVNAILIDYFEENSSINNDSKFNLPNLYRNAKLWEKLTNFYNLDTFIYLLEKYQTLGNLNSQFTDGYEASKKTNLKFNEARLRFALHKSTVKDLENYQHWESEIEARIKLNDIEHSLIIANSAPLKEDRLKLLTIIAKEVKIKGQSIDESLLNQITDLYNQIDFSKIRDKGFDIAGLLIYCNIELAIDLVEKVTDNSASENSLDYAFAHLMLYATHINKKSKTQIADIDLLNSKIQNVEVKKLSTGLRFLSENYSLNEITTYVNSISNFNQKIFILKNWIINNKEKDDVFKAVKLALEEIIKTSSENIPNATVFSELSLPLLYINDKENLKQLIEQFDIHRNSVNRPTKDFVMLQLNIAEAYIKLDFTKATDRIFDVYLFISDLNDFSIKTDCLGLLWLWLKKNDPKHQIELKLSPDETIEKQTRDNIDLLLKDTAFHFKMVESIIITLVEDNPEFIFDTIKKLNTEERRDFSYRLAVENYIFNIKIEKINFNIIDKFYNAINNVFFKEEIFILIIDKYLNEKEERELFISKILKYNILISKITKVGTKCYVLTKTLNVLSFNQEKYKAEIQFLLKELSTSWEKIGTQWEKIEIGFLIARDLAEFFIIEAKNYLDLANNLKNNEFTLSQSTINTYIKSIRLNIRAYCGIVQIKEDTSNELSKLNELINFLDSDGEKLKIWSELALRIYAMNKTELFNQILKKFISPLLFGWENDFSDSYKSDTITTIAPVIYLQSPNLFDSDYYPYLSEDNQNKAVDSICNFILTKLTCYDPIDDKKNHPIINYTQLIDLINLIKKLTSDYLLSNYIERIVDTIKDNRSELTNVMINSLTLSLKKIVSDNFPSKNGIQHEGYKILSEAELLKIERSNFSQWQLLISRAEKIPNISDKSLVLAMLANKLNVIKNNKKNKLQLMDNAFNLIKTIPSIYDKTNRFDATWETFLDIDKAKFQQYLKLAYKDLLESKDGEIIGLRNLIDVAQQHDVRLAEEFVTMLDDDPARKKLKEPFTKRLNSKKRIENACDQKGSITTLNSQQFQEVSRKFIEGLNSNSRTSRDVEQTYELIERASNSSLNEGLNAYMYFIQNAIRRYETTHKNPEILNSIFNATYQNCNLIKILCSNNIKKMQNLYKLNESNELNEKSKNLIVNIGKKEDANVYIKNWLRDNIEERYYFIDPYFTEENLDILSWIKEINPDCQVNILTSKKGGVNSHFSIDDPTLSINRDVYLNAWGKKSKEPPVNTNIKIIWDKATNECPFHDRWYIAGEANSCLYIGTSLNGLGNRESQITIFSSEDELIDKKELIFKYFYRKEKKIGKWQLKYEDFDLD